MVFGKKKEEEPKEKGVAKLPDDTPEPVKKATEEPKRMGYEKAAPLEKKTVEPLTFYHTVKEMLESIYNTHPNEDTAARCRELDQYVYDFIAGR